MKKSLSLVTFGVALSLLAVPALVKSGATESKVTTVKAATETTVYYAVPSDVVGTYTVKLNINRRGDGDNWATYIMTKTSDTLGGYEVYSCTYTDLYDGVGTMQFQLYDGDTHKGEQQPIGIWTPVENYNGKVYVHDIGWQSYTPGLETYLPMGTSFFTNWDNSWGNFKNSDATYWNEGHSYNALDRFYDGCCEGATEGKTGTLISRTWTQTTQYVYFTWGCALDNHRDDESLQVKLRFYYGNGSDYEDMFNDTHYGIGMMLRYFKVPDSFFNAQNGAGFTMHVELIDNRGNDYGAHTLGYFHPNQTFLQVGDACRYFVNHLRSSQSSPAALSGHFRTNGSLAIAWNAAEPNFSCDFETNEEFQNDFTYDYNYGNNDWMDGRHPLEAISRSEYRPDNGYNMPFNKSDKAFFKGWYADGSGYVASDMPTYRFISKPFVVSLNGLVSIKMGGNAASLHLLDGTTFDELAWIDCRAFEDHGEDGLIADDGKSTVTMIRHVINFEEFAGRTVRVGIADYKESGWAVSYFDELKTNIDLSTGFKVDRIAQNSTQDGQSYFTVNDIYINSTHIDNDPNGVKYSASKEIITRVDASIYKAAYDVVSYYFANFRNQGTSFNVCTNDNDKIGKLVSDYSALSAAAQAIVDASEDFTHGTYANEWYRSDIVRETVADGDLTVGKAIQYLATRYHQSITIKNSLLAKMMSEPSSMAVAVVVFVTTALVISFAIFMVSKKRKKQ